MNREEILDLAMDILDNTDATLEEAMGIAIETQVAHSKISNADAKKQVLSAYRGKRGPVYYVGKDKSGREVGGAAQRGRIGYTRQRTAGDTKRWDEHMHEYQRGGSRNIDGITHYSNPDSYRGVNYSNPDSYRGTRNRSRVTDRKGRYLGTYNSGLDNNGKMYVNGTSDIAKAHSNILKKASKEAAIMDTALDFLDMYDVSLEEAIDMAYDYLIG